MMVAPKKGRAVGERATDRPGAIHASERRVKAAPKWSPTLPSAAPPKEEPDPLAEAHAALADVRAALDVAVQALDRIKRRR